MRSLEEKKKEAVEVNSQCFNCAQAVFSTLAQDVGISKKLAFKICTGFGGGIKQGEVCGAVSGAIMAIGIKHGFYKCDDPSKKENAYKLVTDFIQEFKKRNQHTICKQLLSIDVSTKEGHQLAKSKKLFYTVCPKFIEDAIDIATKML